MSTISRIHTRSGDIARQYRNLSLRLSGNGPASVDLDTRSVEVVCATEGRVRVYDYESWQPIDEILLMSGVTLPENRQVPLLDTHSRYSTSSVVGSCRGLQVAANQLIGRAHFANDPDVESVWGKTRDGHITDFSVGYSIDEAIKVKDGETAVIDGRSYLGPVRVVTRWTVKELSVCPIGADAAAKARAEAAQQPGPGAGNPSTAGKPAPHQKENAMDKRLLAFLVSRGLPQDATEEQAYEFTSKLTPESGANSQDVDETVRKALAAERDRFAEITAMGARFGCNELTGQAIRTGMSIEAARAQVMEHLAKERESQPQAGFRVSVGTDERDKFRLAAHDSICLRAGMVLAQPADGATDLRGYSLREIARRSLELANQPTGGDVMEMLGRSMTTGDFANILSNVANKSLFAGYESAGESWDQWCDVGSVTDFKLNTLTSISEHSDLDQITEEQSYAYGKMSDDKETYQIATYGKLFAVTRQTIINDDLSALTDIPMKHGEAAARKVGDIAVAVLTANAAMRDGVALFHADHGNLGTSGAISEVTIPEGIKLMKLQKDLLGKRRLNIRPEFIIAPVTAEGNSEVFFGSTQFAADNKAATRVNPYSGSRFTRVYEARLDDSSTSVWYMLGPKGKTIKVFFLNGQQSPYMETRQGWTVDGVEYKVRIDAGAKALDWKALLKNAG